MKYNTMTSVFFVVVTLVTLMVCSSHSAEDHIPIGGLSRDEHEPTDLVRGYVEDVKDKISNELNEQFKSLKPIKYKHQVVSGMNYFIKLEAKTPSGETKYLHAKIYKHFRDPAQLISVKRVEGLESPITH